MLCVVLYACLDIDVGGVNVELDDMLVEAKAVIVEDMMARLVKPQVLL